MADIRSESLGPLRTVERRICVATYASIRRIAGWLPEGEGMPI